MNIVILGATGRIGRALMYGLRSTLPGAIVTGCTRSPDKAEEQGLTVFHPAYDNWSQLGNVDILINAIGVIREVDEYDFDRAHGGISSLIVCNRDEIGNPKVIQISALGADEAAPERFLQTKGVADRILLSAGNAVVVRPSVVCSDDTLFLHGLQLACSWADNMLGILPVPNGVMSTRIQPVCLADLVELVAELCHTNNHAPVVDLTGAEVYTMSDFFAMQSSSIRIIELPRSLVEKTLSLFRLFVPSLPIAAQHLRLLQQDNTAPNDEAQRLLGRSMRSTLPFWRYMLGGKNKRDKPGKAQYAEVFPAERAG